MSNMVYEMLAHLKRINTGQIHKVVERTICLKQFLSQVGKLLYKQSSSTVKRLGLELGGNAAFLVFPTADLDLAVTIFLL